MNIHSVSKTGVYPVCIRDLFDFFSVPSNQRFCQTYIYARVLESIIEDYLFKSFDDEQTVLPESVARHFRELVQMIDRSRIRLVYSSDTVSFSKGNPPKPTLRLVRCCK